VGFSTVDALYNAITVNGQTLTVPFTKTIQTGATSAAGRWHECFTGGGTGGTGVLTGSAGVGILQNSATTGAIPIGPTVETSQTKHLLSMSVVSPSATIAPAYLLLTDLIYIWPSLVEVTTPTTISGAPTWTGTGNTRLTNANGVQLSLIQTTASSAAGAITPTYHNQSAASHAAARALQGVVAAHPVGALWADTSANASNGGFATSLANGDYGVQDLVSYTIGTNATGGAGVFVLHRPVATIPIAVANAPSERDFTTGPIRLPRIYDGACLTFFVLIGGALTTGQVIEGELVFGWA